MAEKHNSPYNIHPIRPGIVERSRLISIPLQANQPQGTIKFPNQNDLIGMRITRIQLITSSQLASDPNNSGYSVLPFAQCGFATVTLNIWDPSSQSPENPGQSGEWIENYPLLSFYDAVDSNNNYQRHPVLFPGTVLIWESCKINITTAMSNAALTSICLNISYTSSNFNTFNNRQGTANIYN